MAGARRGGFAKVCERGRGGRREEMKHKNKKQGWRRRGHWRAKNRKEHTLNLEGNCCYCCRCRCSQRQSRRYCFPPSLAKVVPVLGVGEEGVLVTRSDFCALRTDLWVTCINTAEGTNGYYVLGFEFTWGNSRHRKKIVLRGWICKRVYIGSVDIFWQIDRPVNQGVEMGFLK